MATTTSGIDVSHFQGKVDWGRVQATGVAFAFAKATEGTTVGDAMFATNWAGIKDAGLLRGAYHFFRASKDAGQQANFFLSKVTLSAGDLPPVLDVEVTDGASDATLQAGVQAWLDAVAAQTGVTPMIYASPAFWNEHMTDQFGDFPLWVAQYGVSAPRVPKGFKNWTFWQYSESGKVDGVSGKVDLDQFQGSMDDLTAFVNAPAAPPAAPAQPPAPTAQQTYTVKSGDTLGRIAAKFGVTVDALAAANGIDDPNVIQVGQVLQIPTS